MQTVSEAATTIIISESSLFEIKQCAIQTVCLVQHTQLEPLRIIYHRSTP
jgi:hypothetical protein